MCKYFIQVCRLNTLLLQSVLGALSEDRAEGQAEFKFIIFLTDSPSLGF